MQSTKVVFDLFVELQHYFALDINMFSIAGLKSIMRKGQNHDKTKLDHLEC